jgi:hypothetical protein
MAEIVAKRLVQRSGFVVMKRRAEIGGAALGRGFALREHDVNTHINPSSGARLAPPLARPSLAAELHLGHELDGVERAPVRAAVREPVVPRLLVERQFPTIS